MREPSRLRSEADRSRSADLGEVPSKRRNLWIVATAVLVVAGTSISVLGARLAAANNAKASQEVLERSSAAVAATLTLAIQREEDLAISGSAWFLNHPDATNEEFGAWATSMQSSNRFPELLGWGRVGIVQASDLPAAIKRLAADPPGVSTTPQPFQLIPPGERPFYCFLFVAQTAAKMASVPPGFDYCAGPDAASTVAARDTGQNGYRVVNPGTGEVLAMQVPFFLGGAIPATIEARRAAFTGWMGMAFDPNLLLTSALKQSPASVVALHFHDSFSDMVFRTGTSPSSARSVVVELHHGWSVETFGTVSSNSLFRNSHALLPLLGGLAFTILLTSLMLVLGTGRERAWKMVGKRTGELQHQALHDPLTGLPNRALIMDRIDQLLIRNRRNGTSGAALYIDLDDFKNINDTLGHEAGDRLLLAVGARLTATLRDADTIGRMGGDEFVVLIDNATLEVAPELVAERLLNVMHQPFTLAGTKLPLIINTSIGVATGDRASAGDLLRDADVALYQAKASGKNRYEMYRPEMQVEITRRLQLEFDLRSAIEDHQFSLAYQPIYNLDNLEMVAVEALLRWEHPTLGPIVPDEFIPILEHTGQIHEVGRWVLLEACRQMAEWHGRGDTLDLAVNVSGCQLDSDDVVDDIRQALEISGLHASSLIIEVTETALMRDTTATARRLRAIKLLGVRISVDDFGTGYSSLAYLQQLPVDVLKFDRRFTNAITTNPDSKALIGTLVQLGLDLGLTTLAEGVETANEMDHLRDEHVNQVQGFLLSRPLDPETLESRFLAPTRPIALKGALM